MTAAPAAAGAAQPRTGDTLSGGYSTDPLSFDPHPGTSGGDHPFFYPLCDPPVGYDQKGNLDPPQSHSHRCAQIELLTNRLSPRGRIKFHDGNGGA